MKNPELAARVLRYRATHGLTQAQMGDLLGIDKQAVYRIERDGACHKARALAINIKLDELEKI